MHTHTHTHSIAQRSASHTAQHSTAHHSTAQQSRAEQTNRSSHSRHTSFTVKSAPTDGRYFSFIFRPPTPTFTSCVFPTSASPSCRPAKHARMVGQHVSLQSGVVGERRERRERTTIIFSREWRTHAGCTGPFAGPSSPSVNASREPETPMPRVTRSRRFLVVPACGVDPLPLVIEGSESWAILRSAHRVR